METEIIAVVSEQDDGEMTLCGVASPTGWLPLVSASRELNLPRFQELAKEINTLTKNKISVVSYKFLEVINTFEEKK